MPDTSRSAELQAALDHLERHADDNLARFEALLRIPSVSAEPAHDADTVRASQWIVDLMEQIGIEHAVATPTPSGHPVVTGDWLHAGPDAPTILVYAHYDVQPPDPLDEWIRPPFEPRYEDGKVFARGASDDKNQLIQHLNAADAWLRTAGRLPLNLRFIFEGDEESSAAPVEEFIAAHPELLTADLCMVSDGAMYDDEGTPEITYGLRGISYFEITVSGPHQDLHSGSYGGAVRNPANVLVKLLAALTDEHGRCTVPGFYDRVRPLTDAERAAYAALPYDVEAQRELIGVPQMWAGDPDHTFMERLSGRPTFDINGLWGGYSGDGSKTIIPARASAKFSTRLVPDQDHGEIAELMVAHLARLAPPEVTVTVKVIQGGYPYITPIDSSATQRAASALERAYGRAPLFARSGGSVPFVSALQLATNLPILLVGFATPNGNYHAPNEWLPLDYWRGGMEAIVHLWDEFSRATPEELRAR